MSLSDQKQERDLKRRVATLEARVAWLEETLARVVGQPAHAQAAAAAPLPAAPLDRFMLRTQPMRTLSWPLGSTAPGQLNTLPEPGQAQAWSLEVGSAAQAAAAAPQPGNADDLLEAFDQLPAADALKQGKFTLDDVGPEEAASGAPLRRHRPTGQSAVPTTVNLGITAAYSTLEAKIAQAADAELAVARGRPAPAPQIEIMPELIDRAAPPPPRKLEVHCALEVLNPSILAQIVSIWAQPGCAVRLQRLIAEDSGGRMGLDPAVKEEVALLSAIREKTGQ